MSFNLHGIGISSGIAIGNAHLLSHAYSEVVQYEISADAVEYERERFETAVEKARRELCDLQTKIPIGSPSEFREFIKLHQMILDDPILTDAPKKKIEELLCNAEWALKIQLEKLLEKFLAIKDLYLRERQKDIIQVAERIFKILEGAGNKIPDSYSHKNIIVVAHDISPTEVIQFRERDFAGFITDVGGTTSHTAIIARSLNVPSVVALHDARRLIKEGEQLIVDGSNGIVMASPSKNIFREYHQKKNDIEKKQKVLKKIKNEPCISKDGKKIDLLANIEMPSDTLQAKENGAEGIGLFRTEFLYLGRGDLPTEEEQFLTYKNAAIDLNGHPIIIRTFDLGADKHTEQLSRPVAPNPALGLRAIRLCLAEPDMFRDQIRAILRASIYGNIKILIPMLINTGEINQTLNAINLAKLSLREECTAFDEDIKIGAMIEVPAAAIAFDEFAKQFDFFSVGTNDLIQYTLAVDRTDDSVSHLYDPLHPAVLELLNRIILKANLYTKPVGLCGEMAGDIRLTKILLGLGLKNLSMHPGNLLRVKNIVMHTNISEIEPKIKKLMAPDISTDERQKIITLLTDDGNMT